jgi:hypothetical protein
LKVSESRSIVSFASSTAREYFVGEQLLHVQVERLLDVAGEERVLRFLGEPAE